MLLTQAKDGLQETAEAQPPAKGKNSRLEVRKDAMDQIIRREKESKIERLNKSQDSRLTCGNKQACGI